MEPASILALMDFGRGRLLNSLDVIEKSGEDYREVLHWRPAPDRAHIAWQVLHCAATQDKYLHMNIKGLPSATDPELVACYGGGSIPTDSAPPTFAQIRETLERHYARFREFVSGLSPADMDRVVGPPDRQRKLGEALVLLIWHEAHHQGQMHLTWNLYKQANGIV